jgi:chromosome segregation protein
VGQAISTGKEHALAIETALGAAANDLIVEHERAAKSAIQYLKEKRLGRATFQPIPLMRPVEVHSDLRRVLQQKGVVGRANELVNCDPDRRPAIDSLLGRVVIVETLDDSLRLAKTSGWARLVTLDGEVVHASGAVSGGQSGRQQYGLVQRKADLDALEKDLRAIERDLASAEKRTAEATAEREKLALAWEGARAEVDRRRIDFTESRDYLHTITSELSAAEKARERLLKELEALSADLEVAAAVDVEAQQSERDALMNELAGRSADANQAKERLRDAEQRLQQAKSRQAAAVRRLDAASHSEDQRAVKLQNLEPERRKARAEIERHEAERERAGTQRRHAESDLRERQIQKDKLLTETVKLGEEAKEVRASVAAMADANHQAELNRARAESRRANAAERLLEEYGISEEDAIQQSGSIEVPPDAQPVANRLRREIRAMGAVNVGAIEAYERLTSRAEELSAQRDDILEGIGQVQASMRELDKLTRDRFLETFTKVEAAYAEMFQKLFGGGAGRIFLDNPDSILESGIEIEVTLPGKKRQRLELLSGGERALCASGFLFALLHVKPSPLVVLDEVDAPLDGRNVERFGDVLQEFTDRTQFIVITHNPTTIERAPVWLGVTMQEPGVSTLVPARLPTTTAVVEQTPAPGKLRPAFG